MSIWEAMKVAWRNLAANKLRSLLTMLGIIIGVSSVIALLSVGRGAQAQITEQIQSIGTNLLFVTPGSITQQGVQSAAGSAATLTLQDAQALANPMAAPSVALVAPEVSRGAQVVYSGQNMGTRITGVTPEYQEVRNVEVEWGEFITQGHSDARSRVAVVGSSVVEELFGEEDPLGKTIKINRVGFRVIGVLETKGGMGMASPDDAIYIPITTAQARLFGQDTFRGQARVSSISVQAVSEDSVEQAMEEIQQVLRQRHNITYQEDDFLVISQEDILQIAGQITGIMTLFLGSIAAISLVVGGIGIMNIMLVSVTERTREIGIRKALGAKQRDVLVQFLVEAVVISLVGGLLGLLGGAGIANLISRIQMGGSNILTVVGLDSVLLAVLFSVGVGVFFGIYPASRAARLHPIEALRYE